MIKRILALSMIVATAGFLVSPVSAQEEGFSASLNGNVRMNYDFINDRKSGKDASDDTQVRAKGSEQSIGFGDSTAGVKLAYNSGETTSTLGVTFKDMGDGTIREYYSLTASTKAESGWTGTGVANFYKNEGAGTNGGGTEDTYVSLSNDMLSFTLGNKEHLFNYYQGATASYGSQLIFGQDSGIKGIGRFNAFVFGYTNADIGLTANVLYGQNVGDRATGDANVLGIIDPVNNDISTDVNNFQNTTYALLINYNNADAGIDVKFEYGSSEAKALSDEKSSYDPNANDNDDTTNPDPDLNDAFDASNDGAKASASYIALGVKFTGVENLGIMFNYINLDSKQAYYDAAADEWQSYNTGENYNNIGLGVDYTIADIGTVSLQYNMTKIKKAQIEGLFGPNPSDATQTQYDEGIKDTDITSFELGFQTKIANTLVRATYQSESAKGRQGFTAGDYGNDGETYTKMRIRMEYSF